MTKYLTIEDVIKLKKIARKQYLPPIRCKECCRSFYFIHERGWSLEPVPVLNTCSDHAVPLNGGIAPGVGS